MSDSLRQIINGLTLVLDVLLTKAYLQALGAALLGLLAARAVPRHDRVEQESTSLPMATRVVVCLAGWLLLIGGVNFLVDPIGYFSTGLIRPVILTSRADKIAAYEAARPAPLVVVLGSSRSFTVPPAYITEVTGLPAFNMSVQGGSPRDFVGLVRFIQQSGKPLPEYFIVATSVEQYLIHDNETNIEPADPLGPFMTSPPNRLDTLSSKLASLLSPDILAASTRSIRAEFVGRSAPYYSFDKDGLAHFSQPFPLDESIERYLAGPWPPAVFDFEALDPVQIAYLKDFLGQARALGIQVIAYIPPFHPRAESVYASQSNYVRLRQQMLELLGELSGQYGFPVYDFRTPATFGGADRMFHDAVHPSIEAGTLMLQILLADIP
jgi:hypothetical protein